jgi:hypothetical protein
MSQKTPQKRVLFFGILAPLALGLLAVAWALIATVILPTNKAYATSNNSTVNFQARLLNSAGAVVPDGYYNVEFKLFSSSSSSGSTQGSCSGDSACLWGEDYIYNGGSPDNRVRVVNGYLTVNLGSICAFSGGTCGTFNNTATINWNQQVWLSMNIGGSGTSATWDGEMSPRLQVTAVPYALAAQSLNTYNNGTGKTSTLTFTPPTANDSITLPDASGMVCLDSTTACGFATGSGAGVILQGSSPGSAQTGNFNVTGSGIVGNLEVGTNSSSGALTVVNGSGSSQSAEFVNQQNIAQKIVQDQSNGTNVFVINGTGAATLENATNSTAAFQVQNSVATSLLNVDTTNSRVDVNNSYSALSVPGTLTLVNTATTGGSLTGNTAYTYKVTALDSAGGETSASASNVITTAAGTNTNEITVSWTAIAGASGYRIYRTSTGVTTGYYNVLGTNSSGTISFLDTGATEPNTTSTPPVTNTAYTSTNSSASYLQLSIGGGGTPTGQVYVGGTIPSSPVGAAATGSGPSSNYVQGNYDYVVNKTAATLQVFDISNPVSPVLIGYTPTDSSPSGVYVQGRYAYVVNAVGTNAGTLQIFDVSNPASWSTSTSSYISDIGTAASATSIYVAGGYAYIGVNAGSFGTNQVQAINVSVPTNPILLPATTASSGTGPTSVFVQGHYLYFTNIFGNTLQVFDISNPAKITTLGGVSTGSGPNSVYVSGRYAYVANGTANTLQVFDISSPTSLASTAIGSVSTGSSSDPVSVFVQGRYAYVVTSTTAKLQVYDISNPTAPTLVGQVTTGSAPSSVYVSGRYAYITSSSGNLMQIFDLGGTYTQALQAGSTETGSLQVDNNATISGNQAIGGNLNVSGSTQVTGNLGVTGSEMAGSIGVGNNTTYLSTAAMTAINYATTGGLLTGGTQYCYKLTAIDGSGNETNAGSETCKTTTGSVGSTNTNIIKLTWSVVPNAAGYRLYRSTGSTAPGTEVGYYSLSPNASAGTVTFYDYGGNQSNTTATPPATNNAVANTGYSTLTAPSIVAVLCGGTPCTGSATWSYQIVAVGSNGTSSLASVPYTLTTGDNTTLTSANTNFIIWSSVTGASSYKIYRTATSSTSTPTSTGLIGTTTSTSFNDTGLPGDGTSAPANQDDQLVVGNGGTPTGQLFVSGALQNSAIGSVATVGTSPDSTFVQGSYEYVVSGSYLQVFDISNPTGPVLIGYTPVDNGGSGVYVQGHYAYVISATSATLQVYDVSAPASWSTSTSAAIADINTWVVPDSIYVSGGYAYLGENLSTIPGLEIINVNSPTNPYRVSTLATGGTTSSSLPPSIFVQGKFLYFTNSSSNTLQVIDVSNPASPVSDSTVGTNSGPDSVYVSGRYAYVTNFTAGTLEVFDVSDPLSLLSGAVASLSINSGAGQPTDVVVQGHYAYVTTEASPTLQAYDITNPTNPTLVGQVTTASASIALSVSGRYAYVVDQSSALVQIFDLGGEYTQQLQAGGTETGTLVVDTNSTIGGDQSIGGGLSVTGSTQIAGSLGVGGGLVATGAVSVGSFTGGFTTNKILAPTSVAVTCNSGCTGSVTWSYVVTAITASGQSTAGSATASITASDNATLNTSSHYNHITWNPVVGAARYYVYRTVAGGTPSTTGYIGVTSGTAFNDTALGVFAISPPTTDGSGGINVNGTGVFEDPTNSSTAFQVQNQSGTAILTVNTSTAGLVVAGTVTGTHFLGGSGTPTSTSANGAGAGTSTETLSITGNDAGGLITLHTGTSPTGSNAVIWTITFAGTYASAPYVTLTPNDSTAAALSGATQIFVTSSATTFVLTSGSTALTAATTYTWFYHVSG